jgi:putative oxidoreductase
MGEEYWGDNMIDGLIAASSDWILMAGRILLTVLFVMTGWEKLTGFSGTIKYMETVPAPMPKISAAIAVVMELFVGLFLVLGIATRPLALLLAICIFGTAIIGHKFWTMEGEARYNNRINFFKNISIIGGLLLLAVTGPGRFALGP